MLVMKLEKGQKGATGEPSLGSRSASGVASDLEFGVWGLSSRVRRDLRITMMGTSHRFALSITGATLS